MAILMGNSARGIPYFFLTLLEDSHSSRIFCLIIT